MNTSFSDNQLFYSSEEKEENRLLDIKLQYFTYFLNPIQQTQIPTTKVLSKWSIIAEVLSEKIDFWYKATSKEKNLHFIPISNSGNYIYEKIYRKGKVTINELNQWDIYKSSVEDHPYVHVFIHTSNNPKNWQKIAMQFKHNVFSNNLWILHGFADCLNKLIEQYWYVININPVTIKNFFWDTVKKYSNIEKDNTKLSSSELNLDLNEN